MTNQISGTVFAVGVLDDGNRQWLRARVGLLKTRRATHTHRERASWRAEWTGIHPRKASALHVLRTIFTRCRGTLRMKNDAINMLGLRTTISSWSRAGVLAWTLHSIRADEQERLVVDYDMAEHTVRMFLMGDCHRLHITLVGN